MPTQLTRPTADRTPSPNGDASATPRTIRPRRTLPGSRAVVGGLLVAVAAVGTYAVATGAGHTSGAAYLAAAQDLPAGHRIERSDLGTVDADLPAATRARVFTDADSLVGAVTLGPVQEGELVQSGAVMRRARGAVRPELSFPLEEEWAVGGDLRPGEHVDLYATYDTEGEPVTRLVVADAEVRAVEGSGSGGLDADETVVLTLAVQDRGEVLAATNAVRGGDVNVVRTTGTADDGGPTEYRAGEATRGD